MSEKIAYDRIPTHALPIPRSSPTKTRKRRTRTRRRTRPPSRKAKNLLRRLRRRRQDLRHATSRTPKKRGGHRHALIGVIETHGRKETLALLEGLETQNLALIEYRQKQLPEFDLTATLKRKPDLILIDELAHSNVPGSRHMKRWQDVQELLAAGIDVYTTVNVQHLESLNDIVGRITGIRVWGNRTRPHIRSRR